MYIKTLLAVKVGVTVFRCSEVTEATLVWNEWSITDLSTHK